MNRSDGESLTLRVDDANTVSGLLLAPSQARACYVLAHGAGAGMFHPFMEAVARELAQRGIATLRYQFPYMEQGGKRPDPPKLAHATVRAAVGQAGQLMPTLPLVAGGKSFGGRMTSQTQAASALPGVRGLVFLGFPLHPAGRPSEERAVHLFHVVVPMLFLQGTRDRLADLGLLERLMERLGTRASLRLVQDADHSFRVPARADAVVKREMMDAVAEWIFALISRRR
ncbi:MAG TPA: alpha/beta family hydrolase [Xanthobacteraceae bacterium]|nr:alpha/beta family hydrolase [Xanthobacteraceae bacterium]